jgi:hypothetical protein
VHSGKAGDERFALDGVALEGPWPGPRDRLLDESGLGKYRFEVKGEGGRVLFSRAFASIYGEWEGTAEAKTVPRAFHESVRFPAPASAWAPYLFVHEFGHHFAGLADEYYTSPTSYQPSVGRPEPWEPNVSADAKASKWRDLVAEGLALPTPWPKAGYYRPHADCIMFTRDEVGFCAVCRRAIERVIAMYARPAAAGR